MTKDFPAAFIRSPTGRIIGGANTTIEKVPYQISLQMYGSHMCGGSIISRNYILTAGHCVANNVEQMSIVIGTTNIKGHGIRHKVAKVIRHESFSANYYGIPVDDIALVRLSEPIEIRENSKPIELFKKGEVAQAGSYSTITGWGITENGIPEVLQTVTVPIITKKKCHNDYSYWGGIPAGQICAAYPEGGKDACQGDSGGPLAVNGRLAGIVSWGNGCAQPGKPGVYTEVAFYRDWIKKHANV